MGSKAVREVGEAEEAGHEETIPIQKTYTRRNEMAPFFRTSSFKGQ